MWVHTVWRPRFRGTIVNLTVWRAEKTTNTRMHFTRFFPSLCCCCCHRWLHIVEFWQFSRIAKARYGKPLCVNAHKMLALCRYTDPIERCQFKTLFICSALWVWAPVHHRNHRLHCMRYNTLHVRWKRVRELPTQMTRSHTLVRLSHISIHFHCVRHTLAPSSSHTATECSTVRIAMHLAYARKHLAVPHLICQCNLLPTRLDGLPSHTWHMCIVYVCVCAGVDLELKRFERHSAAKNVQ